MDIRVASGGTAEVTGMFGGSDDPGGEVSDETKSDVVAIFDSSLNRTTLVLVAAWSVGFRIPVGTGEEPLWPVVAVSDETRVPRGGQVGSDDPIAEQARSDDLFFN